MKIKHIIILSIFIFMIFLTSCKAQEPTNICKDTNSFTYSLSDDSTYYVVDGIKEDNIEKIENVIIPQYYNNLPVKEINSMAFYCNLNLKTIDISNVEKIGQMAFMKCQSLTTVISNNLISIDQNAFFACTALNKINLSKTQIINDGCFDCCTELESINLNSIKVLGSGAFDRCDKLKSVSIGNNLVKYGPNFNTNENVLKGDYSNPMFSVKYDNYTVLLDKYIVDIKEYNSNEFNIPDNIVNVFVFDGIKRKYIASDSNPYIKTINGNIYTKDLTTLLNCSQTLDELVLPQETKMIEEDAFKDASVSKLNINNVTKINSLPTNTKEFVVSQDNTAFKAIDKNLYSKDLTKFIKFANNQVENFKVNDETKVIESGAFVAANIKNLDLSNVEIIESQALWNSEIETISITKVKTIKDEAFYGCRNLTTIDISKVETVGNNVFQFCEKLNIID